MAPKRPLIELFYDVISPYSWLAFEALTRYRTIWNVDMKFRPFFLGAVMSKSGNSPPMMVPAKGLYAHKDLHRQRAYWSVPLQEIKDPFEALVTKGSLSAGRFLVSLERVQPEKCEDAARELWMRRWHHDKDIHLAEHLLQVCEAIGVNKPVAEDVVSKIEHKDVKQALIDNTNQAVDEYGAFGAPWIVVHKPDCKPEAYFGSDRFPVIAWSIGEKYPGAMRDLAKSKL